MKKFLLLSAMTLALAANAQEQAPAFPGAEGFARYTTTGGRGGSVIHVTNLNDSGSGSLRAAVTGGSNRIVVFDVAGNIDLKSDLKFSKNNITILGQTAPYPGITVRYYTITNAASNIIVRFMRFRRSQVKNVNDGADASWGRQCNNIIFDHCSFSWSCDEVASYYDNKNFTMQWCTVAEGLNNSGHSKGAHGYGGIWGGKGASFHHILLAHNNNRSPRFNGARYNWDGYDKTEYANTVVAERVDFRNCVNYNWGQGNGCYGGPGGGFINMVNNYYKAGPGTKNKNRVTQMSKNNSSDSNGAIPDGLMSRYYIKGNTVNGVADYDWAGVISDGSTYTIDGKSQWGFVDTKNLYGEGEGAKIPCTLDEPIDAGDVTTHSAETAFDKVLLYAGASLYRDAVDARYVEEALTGTVTYYGTEQKTGDGKNSNTYGVGGIIDRINDPAGEQNPELPSFPELEKTSRPEGFDTDGDGIPDDWETANGLNPNDKSDGNLYTIDPKGFYTNVEVYANSLVEHIVKAQNADALSAIDEYYPHYNIPAGIGAATMQTAIKSVEYFTLGGLRLPQPQKGVNIRRIVYTNGRVVSDKVMK